MSDLLRTLTCDQLPKLFIFDLDYTLWPFWCDTHLTTPLQQVSERVATDAGGYKIRLYEDVVAVLEAIHAKAIPIAIASRTHAPDIAEELLKLLDLNRYVTYKEIYPGSKLKHFEKFRKNSGVEYEDMVFFDDENRNIVEIGKLGVTCELVSEGTSWSSVENALNRFMT